jgi:ferrous iron transport protein B
MTELATAIDAPPSTHSGADTAAARAGAPDPVAGSWQTLCLVGNPNVGKSVIFGHLTGRYVTVSNYPGTTVEVARGRASRTILHELAGAPDALPADGFEVIDTPGVNTLIPVSEDEKVTRDILLAHPGSPVVQVADCKNLRRALLITLQLAELGVPVVLALNMMDEARSRRVEVDVERLSAILGVPVVPMVATRKSGLKALVESLSQARVPRLAARYDLEIESALRRIIELLPPTAGDTGRGIAIMLAAGDTTMGDWVRARLDKPAIEELNAIIAGLARKQLEAVSYAVNRQRLAAVGGLVDQVFRAPAARAVALSSRIGALAMHPVWGVVMLIVVLAAVYEFVGVFGAGTLVGWIEEGLFGKILNPAATRLVDAILPVAFLRDLVVGEYGLLTMALTYGIAIVLPIVFTFFLAFSVLEDSGYLPRLAVMVNRGFQYMGLNGKAVLPMVLGLGCDTMATLTTRILDKPKERVLVTLLLALGVPCSAQLGVVFGMLGQAGPAAAAVWGGVILGVLFVVGWLAAKVLPGECSAFVLELPPMRMPQLGNIVVKTMARIEWYLREALPLFVVGTLLLFALDKLKLLGAIVRSAEPIVVGLLGLPAAASQAFILGFLRRDYGAAGFFALQRAGGLDRVQVVVALVTMTLFIPCIANWFVMVKERGLRTALWMTAFIMPFALGMGGLLNAILRGFGVTFGG